MPRTTLTRLLLALAPALTLAGCAGPTEWERAFEPRADATLAAAPDHAPVQVREVSWDRIHETLGTLEKEAAASDVPPSEWPPERRVAAQARLLRALQVTADPAAVEVLGVSEFSTTEPLRPGGVSAEDLRQFARTIGATEVVWARRYLGKSERIVDRPVSTYTTGTDWHFGRRGKWGRGGSGYWSESSTAWVPVTVEADENAYIAFFLRR